MTQLVLSVVLAVLILNLLVAAIACTRGKHAESWLLVILLAGTTGAAAAAVMAVLNDGDRRFVDVALIFTATAAITAAVRGFLHRNAAPTPPADATEVSATQTGATQTNTDRFSEGQT